MAYNTGNPSGSSDPRDLSDSSADIDTWATSTTADTHPDRLGVQRLTFHGMENEFDADQADRAQRFDLFLANSGYQFVGDYAAGVTVTEYNQVLRDTNGEFWRASGSTTLPYTTTGAGLPEGGAFIAVGDAALRSELASDPSTGQGALLVRGSVIYVDTIADLQALPTSGLVDGQAVEVNRVDVTGGGGGGLFAWDASSTNPADGYSVIEPNDTATGRFNRISLHSKANRLGEKLASFLPVGFIDLPDTFNNTLGAQLYSDGQRIEYAVSPYDLIDFEKREPVTQYYVNYDLGDNANAGTSSGAGAWKQLTYAINNAVSPAVINLEDDIVGFLSYSRGSASSFAGKLKIKGKPGRTIIAGMREGRDLASFSWSASGTNGAYVSTTSSALFFRAQFDGKYRDNDGLPRPIIDAGSIAACQSTPGTYYWDAGNSALYVHMSDGRVPDPADGWLHAQAAYRFEIQQTLDTAEGIILLENIESCYNTGIADLAGIRYRPETTGVENEAIFGAKNCLSYGASGNAFEIYDADVTVLEDCHSGYITRDGFNYHSFITTGTKGEYMTVYEINCTAKRGGFSGFADQPSVGSSANGSTAHDSMHIIRANSRLHDCVGAIVADVNGVHSLNYNVAAGNPLDGASPRACFWHEKYLGAGTTKEMYLWGCAGWDRGDENTYAISTKDQLGGDANRGDITVELWRGQADGKIDGAIS